jgi:hypothetical protein
VKVCHKDLGHLLLKKENKIGEEINIASSENGKGYMKCT